MRSLNSILLEGSLLGDPVLSLPIDDQAPARCTFSLASDPDPASVPVVVYGRLAAYCSKHLYKGSSVRVVGRIAQDVESTAATGTFCLCVVAEHIELKPSSRRDLLPQEAASVEF
jgi:single-stranded DNA-binding protein